jgi:metal-responsive CopG/Arc/MetJ family transcriptional regulator
MEKTSFQFEKDMIEDLDAIAKERGMNRSQVVRKFLGDCIKECKEKGEIK